jgi:hypothetical protein
VLRNADLLRGRMTNQAFVYRVPPTGPANRLWPLFSHDSTLRLDATTPARLADRLAALLGELLGVTSNSPQETARPVNVTVAWSFPLAPASEAASAGLDSPLSAELPVVVAPTAPFVPSRDLADEDGLCRRLAVRIGEWLAKRAEPQGELRFDIAVYDNLHGAGGNGAKALLQVRDVRIPVELAGGLEHSRLFRFTGGSPSAGET